MTSPITVVWLKRDLRLKNHAALQAAFELNQPIVLLFCFEPLAQNSPDFSHRHWWFCHESLKEINEQIHSIYSYHNSNNQPSQFIHLSHQNADKTLQELFNHHHVSHLFSHEEIGTMATYQRDKKVKQLCNRQGIKWQEFPTGGVVRGKQNRNNWDKKWFKTMNQVITTTFPQLCPFLTTHDIDSLHTHPPLESNDTNQPYRLTHNYQKPGEKAAWDILEKFQSSQGKYYLKHISSPSQAPSFVAAYLHIWLGVISRPPRFTNT